MFLKVVHLLQHVCPDAGHRPQDAVEAQFFRDVSSGLLIFEAGKTAPRAPCSGLQDGPVSLDGPERPQDGPKMAPRWPQDGPKMASR